MRCIVADTTWIVEHDGRIPCRVKVTLNAAVTTNTAATAKVIAFDTESWDIGDCYDAATNKYLTARRAGYWRFTGAGYPNVAVTTDEYWGVFLYNDVVASATNNYSTDVRRTPLTSSLATASFVGEGALVAGSKVVPAFYAQNTDIGFAKSLGSPHLFTCYFSAAEVLS